MRKIPRNLFLAATVVTILNFQSCSKYEDGPAFTLRTKKSRLLGEWELVKLSDENGAVIFPSSDNDYEIHMEFEKDGDFELGYTYEEDGTPYSLSSVGEWEFSSDKEELKVDYFGDKVVWEIQRLTNKELWFEDVSGDKWELEAK